MSGEAPVESEEVTDLQGHEAVGASLSLSLVASYADDAEVMKTTRMLLPPRSDGIYDKVDQMIVHGTGFSVTRRVHHVMVRASPSVLCRRC